MAQVANNAHGSSKELHAGIYPDPKNIETTAALAKRTKSLVQSVCHNVNWSGIFDSKLLPNKTKWRFNAKAKENVDPPKDAFTISVLSPDECRKLVELCELYGFEDCGYPAHYRSNTRMITQDAALAAKLYERVQQCCPKEYTFNDQTWRICGLNERFRWCKYVKGERFGTHTDANFTRSETEQSLYTVNIYLNDGEKEFAGGRTRFYNYAGGKGKNANYEFTVGVAAKPGLALIFNHVPQDYFHDGEEVTQGTKYLMRSDVMYRLVEE